MTGCTQLGAVYRGAGECEFCVWAPLLDHVQVHILTPEDHYVPLRKNAAGYHTAVTKCEPGSLYKYQLPDENEWPDPASRSQPQGVHGPSEVIDLQTPEQPITWPGIALKDYIIYELHVGTFSASGDFDGIIPQITHLKELGVTAVELMPIAAFPGRRNWGYDGVYPYAVQESYGGPEGLKRLVDALHENGLAVILDVVYNHFGPEGNYLSNFGPYFTDRYCTPWGMALNFDGPYSDHVRRFFIENGLYWVTNFGIDALRLDAVHGITDFSAFHLLEEMTAAIHERAQTLRRRIHVIAESDLNDARLVRSRELGGYGLDAQWNDDFHHAVHALLTGESTGYYSDFGKINHLARGYSNGYVYADDYSVFRRRRHGNSSKAVPAERFVVFSQNHDQIGNRMLGERLSELADTEAVKAGAAVVLLSPNIPLLFMGEEYAETARFPYFVDHSDEALLAAVQEGRKLEFSGFEWEVEPPIPHSEDIFQSAKLNLDLAREGVHKSIFDFYKELIHLRKTLLALQFPSKDRMEVIGYEPQKIMLVRRWYQSAEVVMVFHFGKNNRVLNFPFPQGDWTALMDSADEKWSGPGSKAPEAIGSDNEVTLELSPFQLLLYERKDTERSER